MIKIIITLLALFVLYFLAALFCCIETAYTSTNRSLLRDQASQGNAKASLAKRLLENASSFFGTVLFGTNLIHVSITTLVSVVLVPILLKTQFVKNLMLANGIEGIITTLIVTPTLLVFSELVPKAIGRTHADKLTPSLAPVLNIARVILAIPVGVMAFISSKLSRLFGTSKDNDQLGKVTRDDLKVLASMATEQGVLHKESGQIMSSVLELDNKPIESIMVPLVEVESLPSTATIGDVEALAERTGFTRFPVFDKRVDEVIGLVSLRRCLYEITFGNENNDEFKNIPIASMIDRNVTFVPETMTVGALTREFRKTHIPMMVVVDEYGGVVGVVTIEDLLSLLVGGIQDIRNQETSQIQKVAPNAFECDGWTDIRELESWLGIKVDIEGFETAAGLVLKLNGSIPRKNMTISYKQFTIRVLEIQKHKIVKLRFTNTKGNIIIPVR